MASKVYEDEFITEYDDGTEEVRFTEAEWEVMLNDPAFGYVCNARKHRLTDSDRNFIAVEGVCPSCMADYEAEYEETH